MYFPLLIRCLFVSVCSENDQMRVIILFALCQKKIDMKTVKKLEKIAVLSEQQQETISNLIHVHVPLERKVRQDMSHVFMLLRSTVLELHSPRAP